MKIAINALPYTSYQGIEVFFTNILKNWPQNNDQIFVFANKKSAVFLSDIRNIKIIKFNTKHRFILFLLQQFYLYYLIRKHKIEMLFCPSLEHPWLIKNKIITIYDAAPFVIKGESSLIGRMFWKISIYFAKISAKAFITISEFSKNELIDKLKINKNKIFIINVGANKQKEEIMASDRHDVLENYQLTERGYFLSIGNARHRKNLETLLAAFLIVSNNNNKYKLVIVGKMDKAMMILRDKALKTNKNIIFTDFVDEKTKKSLIVSAMALVFPSLYEGFGIPILEAQSLNTPVICSNIPAFREVARSSVLFFPARDAQSLADNMINILRDPLLAEKLTIQGQENIKRYSWSSSSEKLVQIIHQYENPSN